MDKLGSLRILAALHKFCRMLKPSRRTRQRDARPDPVPLSLALQGGGAFGAFTWGVLDRLLEEPALAFDALSGASAGAVNGVLLADGLRDGGRDGAREKLEHFWMRLGRNTSGSFLPTGGVRSGIAFDLSSRLLSPYQLNPFNLNPLRQLLAESVDFEALRADPPLRLLISATHVSDGATRIFTESEVSVDVVLASACLPLLHQAVTIDGESYWDGGYAANPPILPLVEASEAGRILLVQIVPTSGDDHPTTSPGIVNRLNQITFNNALQRDLESVAALQRLSEAEHGTTEPARKLRALAIDHVSAEDWYPNLSRRSAGNLDRSFLTGLRDAGREAASAWLGEDETKPAEAAG
jgi:NTE family protein